MFINSNDYIITFDINKSDFVLNFDHQYYNQTHGQIYMTKILSAILITWIKKSLVIFKINKNLN